MIAWGRSDEEKEHGIESDAVLYHQALQVQQTDSG